MTDPRFPAGQRAKPMPILALLAAVTVAAQPVIATALDGDTPVKTSSGATLIAPKGWTERATGPILLLDPPEAGGHVAIVEVPAARDATAAVANAWQAYRHEAMRPIKLVTPRSARKGWDEEAALDFDTPPIENVTVRAVAFRSAKSWTVMIVDADSGIAAKRGAAINLVTQSLQPAGYRRESFADRTPHSFDATRVAALRAFVADSIGKLGVPGAAFAVIDHGKVVYEGGVGVREVGKPAPVDAHSLFMIASNTKGMSTLLLAELVDEHKLQWDEPVTRVYPAFRLGNQATTNAVLVKHLVCACTGLPRRDADWIFNTARSTPATTTFAQLAVSQPTSGFGEVYQYNNLMASAAGYIGGHIVHPNMEIGAAYDAAMQEKILDPLGMRETTFSMARALASDHAGPHGDDFAGNPALGPIAPDYVMTPYRPAGGAWSSAHDMIKYVGLELSQGVLPNGRRLVSADSLLARRAHSVPTGESQWYGMGLQDDASSGVSVIHHGGSMFGYKTDIMLVPAAGVGAVILTNAENGQLLLHPFQRRLLELLYDGKPEAAGDVDTASAQIKARNARISQQYSLSITAADRGKLAASYDSPELGRLVVEPGSSGLRFRFTSWSSLMAVRHNLDGTLSLMTVEPDLAKYEFVVGSRDGRKTLTMRDPQRDYVFTQAF